MERRKWNLHLSWFLLLFSTLLWSSTYSVLDMRKITSQNHFANTGQSQFNTKNNTRVIAQKGGLAILPCVVKVTSPATVSWIRRRDFQLLTVGLSTHSSDKRFLVEHTRHMGHWSLRIKAVREEDRGLYECQLSIYPTQSIFIELKIVEAIAEISSQTDMHIDETSTLRLECKLKRATENPSFVFWYHDNKMVNYDAQGGFFVTSIASKAQSSLETTQGFSVEKDASTFLFRNSTALSNTANVTSNNLAHTSYAMSIIPASAAPQQQTQPSFLLTQSTSVLTIKQVHFHHAGNYTCAPSNARPASITVHVLRGEKPAAMQHANRSILESESTNSSFGLSSMNGSTGITGHSPRMHIITALYFLSWPLLRELIKLSTGINYSLGQLIKIIKFLLFYLNS